MTTATLIPLAATVLVALIALVCDLRTRRIPNVLTVSALAAALLFHTLAIGLEGLRFSLAGFGVGFGLLFVLWIIGGGGGGDVKLMAALGAWMGPVPTLIIFLGSAAVALAMTLTVTVWQGVQGSRQPSLAGNGSSEQQFNHASAEASRHVIPYAVPVSVVTCVVVAFKFLSTWE